MDQNHALGRGLHNEDVMKNTYTTPTLATQGDVVAATKQSNTVVMESSARPDLKPNSSVGSVGFGL
jgi:hypothetical protein